MSFDWNVESNHNHTANYQLSGLPYTELVAGGAQTISFPRVTKWVVFKANGAVTIKFTNKNNGGGVTGFTMADGDMSPRLELRCAEIFKTGAGTLEVIAGLTTIAAGNFINSDEFSW
jgi:hypothetical protein